MDEPWYYFDLAPFLGRGFYIIDLGLSEIIKQGYNGDYIPVIVQTQAEAESWLEINDIRGSIRYVQTKRLNSAGEAVTKRELCAWLDGFETAWYATAPYSPDENPWNTTTGLRPHRAWREGYLAGVEKR